VGRVQAGRPLGQWRRNDQALNDAGFMPSPDCDAQIDWRAIESKITVIMLGFQAAFRVCL
jgi:hypothetical protein